MENKISEFEFVTCDTFSPDFTQSGASVLWYKAGQTVNEIK